MAVIKPSLKFEGSDLNLNTTAAPFIKEAVRRAVFNKTTNQEGAYLYFLPAYKADPNGNGVWYKKIFVRDNFGANFKEKYYVASSAEDPAQYFSNNFRLHYPEEAKPVDGESNGKKFKKYPFYGRLTERVIYNVAFAQNLSAGAHVLDLPLRNGADMLSAWQEGRDLTGRNRPPINDPDRCVPVFVKLKDNSTNPWMLQVESNQPVQLPLELTDSDYLYNLDDVLIVKPKEEIIAKLREMFSADVFEDCMHGFSGLTKKAVQGVTHSVVAPAAAAPVQRQVIAKATISPAVEIPKAALSMPVSPVNPPPAADIDSLPANPMAPGRMSREEAMRFIAQD